MPNAPAAAPGSSGLTSTMLVTVGVAGLTSTKLVAIGLAESPSSMVVAGELGAGVFRAGVFPLTKVVVMNFVSGVLGDGRFATVLTTRLFWDGVTEGTGLLEG